MLVRLHRQPESPRDAFETTALRITGSGFYLLVTLLTVSTGVMGWLVWNNRQRTTSSDKNVSVEQMLAQPVSQRNSAVSGKAL